MNQDHRVYNFSAGPATLPTEVLRAAQAEFLDWRGLGLSVIEISHRHHYFVDLLEAARAKLMRLLNVPQTHVALFCMGPARAQFSAVPLNLTQVKDRIVYIETGLWSKMAAEEAKRLSDCVRVISFEQVGVVPDCPRDLSQAMYLHYCDNETVHGIEFPKNYFFPQIPLVSDMTSNLFSRVFDMDRFDLIYAGAQKNFGSAGLVLVIVRKACLDRARLQIPSVLHYQKQFKMKSLLYTPTSFSIYLADKMFAWLENSGGIAHFETLSHKKSKLLYDCIDQSDLYLNIIPPRYRSRISVPFLLANEKLNALFLEKSEAQGLFGLKGHTTVGGMRASLYNAMPLSGIQALVAFMRFFEKSYA